MWIYDDDPKEEYEIKIRNFLEKLLKNKDIAKKSARTLGLYKYISETKWKSPEELRESIFLDKEKKKYYFSKKDAKKLFESMSQTGGDDGTPYDKLVMRWMNFIYHMSPDPIQGMINSIEPFAFPLRTIEDDMPGFGDTIALAVDVTAEGNKAVIKGLQQTTPIVFGFLPLPEASTVGLVIGYMISTMFIFFNMAIFITRKHLGEAFTQSFALIPFAGITIQNAMESGDKILEKVSQKRRKIIDKVKVSLPPLGNFLETVVFDPDYQGDPKADAEALKSKIKGLSDGVSSKLGELKQKIQDEQGRAELMTSAKTGIAQFKDTVSQNPQFQNALQTARDKVSQNPMLQNALQTARNKLQGAKRLSKKPRKKSKWRTQKKLKI
jgi:hypothetical protein